MDESEELLAAARRARERAYAPYSGFAVGAALRLRDGAIVAGANVENASYGLALCAERAALCAALQAGYGPGEVTAVAVVSEADRPTAPCGACRQWLVELAPAAVVHCAGGPAAGPPLVLSVAELLPHAFGPADLA